MEARSRSFRISSRVIQVSGEVDMESAPRLRMRIRKNLDQRPQALGVNLADVTYMDSAGIAVLVEALQWAKKERVALVLAEPSRVVRSVIEVTRLGKLFFIADSIDQAIPSRA